MPTVATSTHSEERHRTILQTAMDGFWLADRDGRLLEANEAYCRMSGYGMEELLTMRIADLEATESAEDIASHMMRIMEAGELRFETRHRRKDGTSYPVEVSATYRPTIGGPFVVFVRDISALDDAQRALVESQALLSRAFDHSPLLMTFSDLDSGRILAVNDTFCRVSGFSREESVGRTTVEIGWIAAEERDQVTRGLARDGRVTDLKLNCRSKDGRAVVCRYFGDVVQTPQGKRRFSVAEDITELLKTAEQVRELNRDFIAFLENTRDYIYFKDAAGRYRFCSQRVAKLAGRDSWREMIGKRDEEVFPEEIARAHAEDDLPVVRDGLTLLDKVEPCLDEEGRRAWVSTSKWQLLDEAGEVAGMFGISRDITEQHRQEAALRESEERFRDLANIATIVVFVSDVRQGSTWFNQTYLDFTGRKVAHEIGFAWADAVHPDDRQRCIASVSDAIQRKVAYTLDYRARRHDGQYRWILNQGIPRFDTDGRLIGYAGSAIDITERKEAEAAVQESELRLRDITASMGEWVWEIDEHAVFTFSSAKGAELFGDVIGKSPFDFMRPDEAERLRSQVEQLAATKQPIKDLESRKVTRNGDTIWLLSNGVPILHADGQLKGYRGVDKDITSRKAAEQELIAARNAADTANRVKSEFLANMSHEIRTPLNGILGYVQLLELEQLAPSQREYLAAIATSGKNLSELINDIIDMSKIEADRVTLEQTEFTMRDCIRSAVAMQHVRLVQKGLKLQLQVADDVPAMLVGDELRVKQIVLNILSNAVKFTERGTITIAVTLRERRETAALVEIAVTDTGVGMSALVADAVFEPFVQADSSITRRYGGSGLGLSICRRLAELMGGRIELESKEGVGSTFRVLLPFGVAGQTSEPTGAEREVRSGPHAGGISAPATSVLLVEDNEMNQRFGMTLLKTLGFSATLAADGEAALAALARDRYDVVLMDIQMPVMDGRKALRLLREREAAAGAHTPIIAVTAFALKGDAERFLAEGFDGYLSKPLLIQSVVATIQRVVQATGTPDRKERK
jgi:PAS domain S-box-containing protein